MMPYSRLEDRPSAPIPVVANDWLPRKEVIRENAGVVVLSCFISLMFLIPTRLVFPPLGAAGRPVIIAGVALLVLWGLLTLIVGGGLPPGPQPIRWVVLVYLVTQIAGFAAGYLRGLSKLESNSADRWMLSTLAFVGVVLCFADAPRSRRQLDLLLRILLGLGVFAAMVGAAQFFTGFDLQQRISIPGLRTNSHLLEATERGTGGVARVAGMTSHYIEFGVVLAAMTPIAIHYALYERDPKKRLIRWSVVVAIAGAVPLSVSRSGIVALGIGVLTLAVVWSWRMRFAALLLGIVAIVIFRAVSPGVLGTLRALFLSADQDPSVQGRTEDYDRVFPMVFDHLLFGRGAGTFIPEKYILLDNQFLGTLVSTGVVGLIGFLGLFVGGMVMARSIRRRARADEDRHLGQALCASIAACLATSLTFDSLSFVQFTFLLSALLGTVGALWRLSGTSVADVCVTTRAPNGRVMPPLWPDMDWVRR